MPLVAAMTEYNLDLALGYEALVVTQRNEMDFGLLRRNDSGMTEKHLSLCGEGHLVNVRLIADGYVIAWHG